MNFQKLNDGLVYDPNSGVVGRATEINLLNGVISILHNETVVLANLKDVKLLELIGAIGENSLYDRDVLIPKADDDDKMWEVTLTNDGKVQIFLLNDKLERLTGGEIIEKSDLPVLEPYVEVFGSIFELEPKEDTVDFNVKVVREMDGNRFVAYHYACNNKVSEEVDVIKVVFVGHHLLEEEEYERVTLTHEQYLSDVENGVFVEVSPQELANYVTGMTYKDVNEELSEEEEEEEAVEESDDWEEDFWDKDEDEDEDWDD